MISIYGHSDDVVVIEGDVNDELPLGKLISIGSADRGMRVKFQYSPNTRSGNVWRGSVEQWDEGVPMFPISVGEADPSGYPTPRSYSVKFTIDCPPGTPITVGNRNLARKLAP